MILIDPTTRPATTMWATALLAMNGGLFVIPITATSLFGGLGGVAPNLQTGVVALGALGLSLMLAAWAAWRGSHWPRYYVLVVGVGDFVGLLFGQGFLVVALILLIPAAWLLWQPSAVEFAADVKRAPRSARRSLR